MQPGLRVALILGGIIAAIALAVYWFSRPDPIEVRLATVDRGLVESTVANTRAGTVKACQRAQISPSIGGRIDSLPVDEGDRVEAGEVLLELWNDDLEARLPDSTRWVTPAERSEQQASRAAAYRRRLPEVDG